MTGTQVCVCVSVRTFVHEKFFFSDFHLIWCVGRPRPHMRTSVTSTRSKVTTHGQGHRASEVAKIALFKVYILRRFGVELKTDGCW